MPVVETKAMEDYVSDGLKQGLISRSTSPASAGLFFIKKKDGGLRTCIDYHRLNAVTVKYLHSLPFVPSAIEQLCGFTIYTKLDKSRPTFWSGFEQAMSGRQHIA